MDPIIYFFDGRYLCQNMIRVFSFDEYAPLGLLIIHSKEKINISCSSHLGLGSIFLKKFIQGKVSCRHLLDKEIMFVLM